MRSGHDDLTEYRRKRDPASTNEPFGTERIATEQATRQGFFVVHQHHASRLHYDLRLQVGNVLASFAVPKGPSMNPQDSRLAVQTEHHDLLYLDFEDVIPQGNYGAGPMIVWDFGSVRYRGATAEQGLADGKLDLELDGFKLRGGFVLLDTSRRSSTARAAQASWLLRKKPDAFASSEDVLQDAPRSVLSGLRIDELARRHAIAEQIEQDARERGAREREVDVRGLVPMLCANTGAQLQDAERIYELKLDGVRIIAERIDDQVILRYRNGRAATLSYPEAARAVRALAHPRVVLDGEIVAFDEAGRPSFQALAPRIHGVISSSHWWTQAVPRAVFFAFDLIRLGDLDLRPLPLSDRKQLLEKLVPGKGMIRRLDHLVGDGAPLYDFCRSHGLEGIVAKRRSSPYRPGPSRSADWVKLKCEREDDFTVVGWTRGNGGRQALGALLLASLAADGSWRYRGRVGSGLDAATIARLLPRLKSLQLDHPADGMIIPPSRGVPSFARPELVVSVQHLGWTDDGKLRHPVLRGLREDMDPASCTAAPGEESIERLSASALRTPKIVSARGAVTNQDKVFWPEDGFTKGDLMSYYAAVAPALLPYLRNRPIVLVRYPDGIDGEKFHQWRPPKGAPSWVRSVKLGPESESKRAFVIDDVDGLLYVVNLGCIDIHLLASREHSSAHCDFVVIDFDLGEQPLRSAVTLACELRAVLEDLGMVGFPKTSGQSGLHVLVPLGAGVGFPAAKLLADLLGRLLVSAHEPIATMERRRERRGPRVYVDTGQVGPTRTIAAPYAVRARRGAPVSTPLEWAEVNTALDPARYTIVTVPDRIISKPDPMAAMLHSQPDLGRALARLEHWVGK